MENDETTTAETQILSIIQRCYSNLYNAQTIDAQDSFEIFTENMEIPKLDDAERDALEGPLTYEECKKSLETFENENSPGEEGFTVKFYRYSFELVGKDLLASQNGAYELGRLSVSQRRGIITLLPKDDSELLLLQNWRPITLLNVDYKIASKAIARRIESILSKLVHSDQTCFIKGRYIGGNVRLVSDIMEQTQANNTPGILILIS